MGRTMQEDVGETACRCDIGGLAKSKNVN